MAPDLRMEVGVFLFDRPDICNDPKAEAMLRAYWEGGTQKVSFEQWLESVRRGA